MQLQEGYAPLSLDRLSICGYRLDAVVEGCVLRFENPFGMNIPIRGDDRNLERLGQLFQRLP
jgi:hypothetical protein